MDFETEAMIELSKKEGALLKVMELLGKTVTELEIKLEVARMEIEELELKLEKYEKAERRMKECY
jgi:hypothetical protein